MTILLITIAVLLILFMTVFYAASKIPVDWLGLVKKQFSYPLITVWDYVSDIEGIPIRNKKIWKLVPLIKEGDSILKWKEYTYTGVCSVYEKTETRQQRLEKRMIKNTMGITGTWTYAIEGGEFGCTLTIIEKSNTTNPFARVLLKLIGRNSKIKNEIALIEKFVRKSSSAVSRQMG